MCGIFGDFFEEIEEKKMKLFLENLFAPVCRSRQWGEAVAVLFGPDQVETVVSGAECQKHLFYDEKSDYDDYDDSSSLMRAF